LALAGLAEASLEAAAGAEADAGASAANAETANKPAIKAAISFFILTSLYQIVEGRSIRINRSGITSINELEFCRLTGFSKNLPMGEK